MSLKMAFDGKTRSEIDGAWHRSHSVPSRRGSAFQEFLQLSAHIGRDPLLTQSGNGDTSFKVGDYLWVKGSGKWLANALQEEMFLPLSLAETRKCVRQRRVIKSGSMTSLGWKLRPSIETAMHAILPHRVVIQVPSVNTLSHAIRSDAEEHIGRRLSGLRWRWLPYVPFGLALARRVDEFVRASPDFEVLVLGNHGLVVCGDDCANVERLLNHVESRLAAVPREAPAFDKEFLLQLVQRSKWRLPENDRLHCLATDRASCSMLACGNLYPSQAVLLNGTAPWMYFYSGVYSEARRHPERYAADRTFLIVRDRGVLLSNDITNEQLHTLAGLAEVVQRVEADAPVRYLTRAECEEAPAPKAERSFRNAFNVARSA